MNIVATRGVAGTLDDILSPIGISVIRVGEAELVREAVRDNAIAAVSRSKPGISAEEINALRQAGVEVIARACVGYDGIDLGAAYEAGMPVINTPLPARSSVAELTLGQMTELLKLNDDSSYGKRLGIIGVGRIGSKVAEEAKKLGMSIYGYDPYLSAKRRKELVSITDIQFVGNLAQLLNRSDIITLHANLTVETEGMIGHKAFEIIKNAGPYRRGKYYLLNMARGKIVDEAALLSALERNVLTGAALDVYEKEPLPESSPLKQFQEISPGRLLLTPHIGASKKEVQDEIGRQLGTNLVRYFLTRSAVDIVNLRLEHVHPKEYHLEWAYHGLIEFLGYLSASVNTGFWGMRFDYQGEYVHYPSPQTMLLQTHALKGAMLALSPHEHTIIDAVKLRNSTRIEGPMEDGEFPTKHPLIGFQGKSFHLTRHHLTKTGESLFRVSTYGDCFPKLRVVGRKNARNGFDVGYYNGDEPIFTGANLSGISNYVLVIHHQGGAYTPLSPESPEVRPLATLGSQNNSITICSLQRPLTKEEINSLRDQVIKARQFYID